MLAVAAADAGERWQGAIDIPALRSELQLLARLLRTCEAGHSAGKCVSKGRCDMPPPRHAHERRGQRYLQGRQLVRVGRHAVHTEESLLRQAKQVLALREEIVRLRAELGRQLRGLPAVRAGAAESQHNTKREALNTGGGILHSATHCSCFMSSCTISWDTFSALRVTTNARKSMSSSCFATSGFSRFNRVEMGRVSNTTASKFNAWTHRSSSLIPPATSTHTHA